LKTGQGTGDREGSPTMPWDKVSSQALAWLLTVGVAVMWVVGGLAALVGAVVVYRLA